jgi:tRNA nucleotidyltransferase (CCA-adding enzyme)
MRRVNIQAAFVGEPDAEQEGLAADASDEAVFLTVRSGEIVVVVPEGTTDDGVMDAAGTIRGTLHLENERVLTFEIQDGAVGAWFEDEAATLYEKQADSGTVGLFSLGSRQSRLSGAGVQARELMRTEVITATPDMGVAEVTSLLAYHHFTGLPVMEGDRLVGVVSEADVIGKEGSTVGDIMTREVVSVAEDTPAAEVASILTDRGIRRVPVVRDGKLVGIVSRSDVINWLAGAANRVETK